MDRFNERLYELLGEYFPSFQNKKLNQSQKHLYMSLLSLHLTGVELNGGSWSGAIAQKLISKGVESGFAEALFSIRDDWTLEDLED